MLIPGDNTLLRTQRERWIQEDSVALSGWCEDGAAQTGVPHFCGQCSGFSCSWEGEGRSNTSGTAQTALGHEEIFSLFP